MRRSTDVRRLRRGSVAGTALLLVLGAAHAQEPRTDWIDEALLGSGAIQVYFGESDRFRGRLRAAALIEAPPERIWNLLKDCEGAAEYLDNVLSCELLETLDGGQAQIFRQRVKLRWFLPSFEHVFRLDYERYRRMVVSRVSGPLRRLDAVWWLMPVTATRTRVLYRLDLEPGPLIPNFLLTAPLRRDVRNALRAVRARAELASRPPA